MWLEDHNLYCFEGLLMIVLSSNEVPKMIYVILTKQAVVLSRLPNVLDAIKLVLRDF